MDKIDQWVALIFEERCISIRGYGLQLLLVLFLFSDSSMTTNDDSGGGGGGDFQK